jgi:hypothetical protein
MPSGIKIKDTTVGAGLVAGHQSVVLVHLRCLLRRGEEVSDTRKQGRPMWIDLAKRDCVAGLRQGIEGMRAGGRRELVVSPHLAYGDKGAGTIPPKAVLRFEVELLEIREPGASVSFDCGPVRQLVVFRPGEAARNSPRWQFGLRDGDSASVHIAYPIPGMTWRHTRETSVEIKLDPKAESEIWESATATLADFPADCLQNDDLWADPSEKANSITRTRDGDLLCVSVTLWERGALVWDYALPEASLVLRNAKFYQIISKALAPHLPGPPLRGG